MSIFSQLLAERYGSVDADGKRFAEYVIKGARQMERLLKAILEYSAAGDLTESTAYCNSRAAFERALSNLASPIKDAGARITCGDLPEVAVPESAMVQLFQNLVGNALKFRCHRPLVIEVSVTREGAWQKFSISDSGIGVKPEYLTHVFGVFKRLHKDEYPGVGIGLALCKRLVKQVSGRIWAESEDGVGTTVYFTVPAKDVK